MTFHPRELQTFLAIERCGSIGRAALELGLTQPAVSRSIKRLEEDLGVALFERLPTGMALTAYGRVFKPYAELLSAEATHAVDAIDALRGLKKGVLRIGAIGSAVSTVLPEAVRDLYRHHPHLSVKILEAIEDVLVDALVAGDIDLALVVTPVEDERIALIREYALGDSFQVVARSEHPLHAQASVELADLLRYPWIAPPPSSSVTARTWEVFAKHGLAMPEVVVETRSITALRSILLCSDFVACIPKALVATEVAAGLVRPFPFEYAQWQRNFFLLRRRRGLLPPPAMAFLGILKNLQSVR